MNIPADVHAPTKDAVAEIAKSMQRQIEQERMCADFSDSSDEPGSLESPSGDTEGQAKYPQSPTDTELPLVHSSPRRRVTIAHGSPATLKPRHRPRRESIMSETVVPTKGYIHVKPGPHPRGAPPYQRARLLLNHFGHLDLEGLKRGDFYLLAKTPALYRDLKVLDRKHG